MHNVSKTPHSYILADIFRYKGLIVGCTTYNMNLYPEMEALLSKIAAREMKNRVMGYFGSFTWASAAVKKLAEYAEKLKFELVGNDEAKHERRHRPSGERTGEGDGGKAESVIDFFHHRLHRFK